MNVERISTLQPKGKVDIPEKTEIDRSTRWVTKTARYPVSKIGARGHSTEKNKDENETRPRIEIGL